MPGAILQLVANSGPQNRWIDHEPQITFFKRLYRRATPFATELIPLRFKNVLDFGKTATAVILPKADLVHRIFLVFDIPELSAEFINTKSKDISNLLQSYIFTDKIFSEEVNKLVHSDYIELPLILNLIDETLDGYDEEDRSYLGVVNDLEKFDDPVGTKELGRKIINFTDNTLDTESFDKIQQKRICKEAAYDYTDLKQDMANIWFINKKEYYPIYEYIKFIYQLEKPVLDIIPLFKPETVINDLLYGHIFYDIFPCKEILLLDHLKNFGDSRVLEMNLLNNNEYYHNIHTLYGMNNYDIDMRDIGETDFYKSTGNNNILFDEFGSVFHNILNTYISVINVVKTLATTIPNVIIKPFVLGNNCIEPVYLSTIIDPNFKTNFLLSVNGNEKPIEHNNFIPIDFTSTTDFIHPNEIPDRYLNFFNRRANTMFDTIQKSMDILFEAYRNRLFYSTDKLFYNNHPEPSNIYSYLIPTENPRINTLENQENVPITNPIDVINPRLGDRLVNLNIWFFYFFKYLNTINEDNLANFLKNNTIPSLSNSGGKFMKNLLSLLKINIDYYMHEISYMMNDLYASSPVESNDSMKNYVPPSQNDYKEPLLLATFIFHRNHVPSILEMFQFIYYFIDTIDAQRINNYLEIRIGNTNAVEIIEIRKIVKLFYYNIFAYFMNVYDSLKFEAPAGYSTNEFKELNNPIRQYIDYIFNSKSNDTFLNITEQEKQQSLHKVIAQMEFYFVAEMLNIRELQKMYHDLLSNTDLITSSAGSTSAGLATYIINQFRDIDDHKIGFEFINSHPDRTRVYWDELYRHNSCTGHPDNLYYSTFCLDRYHGESYIDTEYQSRHYGWVQAPIDLPFDPPINPYGIDPRYFNNSQTIADYVPLPPDNSNEIETQIPVYWKKSIPTLTPDVNNEFQLFEIDFFRIKHKLFFSTDYHIPCEKTVNEFQVNLIKFSKMVHQLKKCYPMCNTYLLSRLYDTTFYLLKHIDPDELYTSYLKLYDFGIEEPTLSIVLNTFLGFIDMFPDNDNILKLPIELMDEIIMISKELIKKFRETTNYNLKNLMESNNELYSTGGGILDKLVAMKNNFISQYFYYINNSDFFDKISKIDRYTLNDKKSMVDVIDIILTSVDIKINFPEDPVMKNDFMFHPEKYSYITKQIMDIYDSSDDLIKDLLLWLFPFMRPNIPPKLFYDDIYTMVNKNFTQMKDIYQYMMECDQLNSVKEKLEKYQPLFNKKLSLYNEIRSYLMEIPRMQQINKHDIAFIMSTVEKYGINSDVFIKSFVTEIVPEFNQQINNYGRGLVIEKIADGLDIFLLDSFYNGIEIETTDFKNTIISDLFDLTEQNNYPVLYEYFKQIDGQYYPFIYFFIEFLSRNGLEVSKIKNPLSGYIFSDGIKSIADVFEQLLEYISDSIRMINPNQNIFHYDKNFELISKEIYERSTNEPSSFVDGIVNALNSTNNPYTVEKIIADARAQNEMHKDYFGKLNGRNGVIEFNKDIAKKGLIVLRQQRNEILLLKNQISGIIYRNRKAKCAWIRKLAHYLVKNIEFKCDDQLIDYHISHWFESFHEISKKIGVEKSYNKMIGNRKDLTIFNDHNKKSYTIVMPLIFYFSRYISSSIPLNASMNTRYEITVSLRNLDEVSYREQFSEFVDPKTSRTISPVIKNAHLMAEYIYLSVNERKIFAGNLLEYLTDELQYDIDHITDNRTIPVYKIGTDERTIARIKNGIKVKEKYYQKSFFLDKNQIDELKYKPTLMPRCDYRMVMKKDRHGLVRGMMVNDPLPVDKYIHQKRFKQKHNFNNPTKFMVVLIQPDIHTDITLRSPNDNYFYGERQWDNYGLYPYYDLSKINSAKNGYYTVMKDRMNDQNDPVFGFINIINQLLLRYIKKPDDENDWITTYYELFLENLQKIKDAYMLQIGSIKSNLFEKITDQLFVTVQKNVLDVIKIKYYQKLTELFNTEFVELIDYEKNLVENPKISPLIKGYIKFNDVPIMPENSDNKMWTDIPSVTYFRNTPNTGINLHSWALDPLSWQPSGAVNTTKVSDFDCIYDVHPLIGSPYPATVTTMVMDMNIMRYLSGMCAKAWTTLS